MPLGRKPPTEPPNGHADPSNGQTGPHFALSPKTAREAITFMLKGYGEYPDETRIAFYLETLQGCTADQVWEAVKDWARQPHDRSAKPGEIKDAITRHHSPLAPVQQYEDDWGRQRITPEEKQEVIRGLTPKARALLYEAAPHLMVDVPVEANPPTGIQTVPQGRTKDDWDLTPADLDALAKRKQELRKQAEDAGLLPKEENHP